MFLDIRKYPRRSNLFPFRYKYPSDIEITYLKKSNQYIFIEEMIDFLILNDYEEFYKEWKQSDIIYHEIEKFCSQLNGQITLYDCKWFDINFNTINRKHLIGFEFEEDSMAFRLKWL